MTRISHCDASPSSLRFHRSNAHLRSRSTPGRLPTQEADIEQAESHQRACQDDRTVVGATFATAAARFGTDYTCEKAPKKDPPKQIIRSCFPMEEEKDNRVYGAMDGAIRGNMFGHRGRRTRGDITSDAGPYPL